MQLSEHFTLEEFTRSETARQRGIDNSPCAEHLRNLKRLAAHMEQVRTLLGDQPIVVTSGYRCEKLNQAVGGSLTSDHSQGLACDFHCPGYGTTLSVVREIAGSDLEFDQLIFEQGGTAWTHMGLGSRMRQEVLSWSPSKGYRRGIVILKPDVAGGF